jgi:hypothetical protein
VFKVCCSSSQGHWHCVGHLRWPPSAPAFIAPLPLLSFTVCTRPTFSVFAHLLILRARSRTHGAFKLNGIFVSTENTQSGSCHPQNVWLGAAPSLSMRDEPSAAAHHLTSRNLPRHFCVVRCEYRRDCSWGVVPLHSPCPCFEGQYSRNRRASTRGQQCEFLSATSSETNANAACSDAAHARLTNCVCGRTRPVHTGHAELVRFIHFCTGNFPQRGDILSPREWWHLRG